MVKIVCCCKQLVEVIDKKIVDHKGESGEQCYASGMTYIAQRIHSSPGGPTVELIASKEAPCLCGGEDHKMQMGLLKISVPNPNWN